MKGDVGLASISGFVLIYKRNFKVKSLVWNLHFTYILLFSRILVKPYSKKEEARKETGSPCSDKTGGGDGKAER
jgi:hypothetical protein